jgi:putative transposase
MATPQLPLEPGGIYHIYSHANGSENLIRVADNCWHFLKKYFLYIQPAAGTYAYCLMPNHFHAMIHVHDEEKLTKLIKRKSKNDDQIEYPKLVSRQISHFLNGYIQAYNRMFGRMGSLFIPNFKRRKVETSDYFIRLVAYIHRNPIKNKRTRLCYEFFCSSTACFIKELASSFDKGLEFSSNSFQTASLSLPTKGLTGGFSSSFTTLGISKCTQINSIILRRNTSESQAHQRP